MAIKMTNCSANNNGGDGLRIEGDIDVHLEGFVSQWNGGHGINILRHAGLLDRLGLPKETDPLALAELLSKIQNVEILERANIVRDSGILHQLGRATVDVTTVIANIVTISSLSYVPTIIAALQTL